MKKETFTTERYSSHSSSFLSVSSSTDLFILLALCRHTRISNDKDLFEKRDKGSSFVFRWCPHVKSTIILQILTLEKGAPSEKGPRQYRDYRLQQRARQSERVYGQNRKRGSIRLFSSIDHCKGPEESPINTSGLIVES